MTQSEERASAGLSSVAISQVFEQSSDLSEFRLRRRVYRTRQHGCKTPQRAASAKGWRRCRGRPPTGV